MAQPTLERPPAVHAARRRNVAVVTIVSVVSAVLLWWPGLPGLPGHSSGGQHSRLGSMTVSWPSQGQSALELVGSGHAVSGPQPQVPIASVTKVMTAYVVLRNYPIRTSQSGFTLHFTAADAAQAAADKAQDQSYVPVEAGEQMSEREALEALLLPSANNIAHALADHADGGEPAFVASMNAEARRLDMHHTRYTDPSGLDSSTISTALDQLRLARAAMRLPVFAAIVAMPRAVVPVAGTIASTDTLLGHDGFVGIKTGSTAAAGGCFMFEARQVRGGRSRTLIGVVLGQIGGPLIRAGLTTAQRLVESTMTQLT